MNLRSSVMRALTPKLPENLLKQTSGRYFSLLEIMVAVAILAMAAGSIGWKMHAFIQKKRIRSELEQLRSRMQTAHILAVNMQADWEGDLKPEGNHWAFEAFCLDPYRSKTLPSVKIHLSEVLLDGKSLSAGKFLFASSGAIIPEGILEFRLKGEDAGSWQLPGLFGIEEGDGGKKPGPLRPDAS